MISYHLILIHHPQVWLRCIVMSTSVCLSVREYISSSARAIFFNFFVHVAYGSGLVLLRCHYDALCTSGFVDDIVFIMGRIVV